VGMHVRPGRSRPFATTVFALGLWALGSAASAQVYRWVDPDGSIHYSDSPASAPKDAKVETTAGDEITVEGSGRITAGEPAAVPRPSAPASTPAPERSPPPPAPQQADGTDEQTVRQFFRNTHRRIAELERQIAGQRKAVESANAAHPDGCQGSRADCLAWGEQQRAHRDEARRQLAKLEADLQKWKSYLDDLERWASSKSVPRAWRQ